MKEFVKISSVTVFCMIVFSACQSNNEIQTGGGDSGTSVSVNEVNELSSANKIYASSSLGTEGTVLLGGEDGLYFSSTGINEANDKYAGSARKAPSNFKIPLFSIVDENTSKMRVASRVASTDENSTKVKIFSIYNMDNSIYIGGHFSFVNGVEKNSIVKLTNTGAIDGNFQGSIEGSVYKIVSLGNEIIIAGMFGAYNDKITHSVAKIDVNGVLDEKFTPFNEYMLAKINDIAVLPSNQIMVAGTFIKEAGQADENSSMEEMIQKTKSVIVLNKDGSVDEAYSEKFSHIKHEAFAIDINGDNIYIGGDFEFIYENKLYNNLVAYSLKGELNESFQIGKLSGVIFDVKVNLDKVIYVGDFIIDDSLQTRSFYISNLLGETINISNFSVDSNIYSIEIYEGSLVLTGEGNFKLNNEQYNNNISLKLGN